MKCGRLAYSSLFKIDEAAPHMRRVKKKSGGDPALLGMLINGIPSTHIDPAAHTQLPCLFHCLDDVTNPSPPYPYCVDIPKATQ
jgi:hypothetical protein